MTTTIGELSDEQLIAETRRQARDERTATSRLIRLLAEVDARRLYLRDACPSLFIWCTQVLHLSEAAAYNRIEVARLGRRFPAVLDALDQGDVTLTTLKLLGPYLTDDNHKALLASSRHRSKREVEDLLAPLAPAGPVPAGLRETTIHIGPNQYEIRFTITAETREKLFRARDLLRHVIPRGEYALIVDRALTALLLELERRRFAAAVAPRPVRPGVTGGSRHIPASVRRMVRQRDGEQCAFVGADGQRCRERGFLEFHHVEPYAAGGAATLNNISLRCRRHNQHEAEVILGKRSSAVRPATKTGPDE